jgi:N-acetylmuramoyl-L-alanine amidase
MKRILYIITFFLFIVCTSVFAQTDKGTPRNGEGIDNFLIRHKRTEAGHRKQFIELNKGKFGRNNSLLKGVTYVLPPVSGKKKTTTTSTPASNAANTASTQKGTKLQNKLFGAKYQDYTVKSSKLKGATFFLSSGHGGPDPGAIGKVDGYELHEDEYAYDITLRLARNLLEEGATVI